MSMNTFVGTTVRGEKGGGIRGDGCMPGVPCARGVEAEGIREGSGLVEPWGSHL